jgi:hypothetical protein
MLSRSDYVVFIAGVLVLSRLVLEGEEKLAGFGSFASMFPYGSAGWILCSWVTESVRRHC